MMGCDPRSGHACRRETESRLFQSLVGFVDILAFRCSSEIDWQARFRTKRRRRDMKVAQGVSPGYVYKRGEPRRGGTKIHVTCVAPLGLACLTPRTQALRPGLPLFRALRALRSSWVTNPTSISKYKPGQTGRAAMVFNYQSQITNHKLPITNYQSQITNHKLQILASHQFLCPLRGLDHGVHQCHAQPATLELHQAFDGAAGRRGDCAFEHRGMMAGP